MVANSKITLAPGRTYRLSWYRYSALLWACAVYDYSSKQMFYVWMSLDGGSLEIAKSLPLRLGNKPLATEKDYVPAVFRARVHGYLALVGSKPIKAEVIPQQLQIPQMFDLA